MNYNSGNARRNFYAKWDKLREEYRAAGMKEDAIQKMYEYDLAVFNDDRATIVMMLRFRVQTIPKIGTIMLTLCEPLP